MIVNTWSDRITLSCFSFDDERSPREGRGGGGGGGGPPLVIDFESAERDLDR